MFFALLALLVATPLSTSVPEGVPDSSAWDSRRCGAETLTLGNPFEGKAVVPLAEMTIRTGVCPDTKEECEVVLEWASSIRKQENPTRSDWVIRWRISRGKITAEGLAYQATDATPRAAYWHLEQEKWRKVAPDSPEYQADTQFASFVARLMFLNRVQ